MSLAGLVIRLDLPWGAFAGSHTIGVGSGVVWMVYDPLSSVSLQRIIQLDDCRTRDSRDGVSTSGFVGVKVGTTHVPASAKPPTRLLDAQILVVFPARTRLSYLPFQPCDLLLTLLQPILSTLHAPQPSNLR